MLEIIDVITDLIHTLKYGYIINGRKNFKKLISSSDHINETVFCYLKEAIKDELHRLKIKFYSTGEPVYVFFEVRPHAVKVFVLNEKFDFLCRLEDIDIESLPLKGNSFLNIEQTSAGKP